MFLHELIVIGLTKSHILSFLKTHTSPICSCYSPAFQEIKT